MLSPESTFYYTLLPSSQSNKEPGKVCGMGRCQEQRMDELPLCQAGDEGWLGSCSGALNPMCVRAQSRQLYLTLWDPMDPARPLCPWDSPGKNTGVGCHALLQGTFEPASLTSPAMAGRFFTTSASWKPPRPNPIGQWFTTKGNFGSLP